MANSNQSEKLLRNMSIIQEEEDGLEYVVKNGCEALPLEPTRRYSNDRDGNVSHSIIADIDTGLQKADSNKNVTFNDDSQVFFSFRGEMPTPALSVDTPIDHIDALDTNSRNIENVSKDSVNIENVSNDSVNIEDGPKASTAFTAALDSSLTTDNNYLDKTTSHPSNHQLSSPTTDSLLSVTGTTPQEKDQTVRRFFEVSNVDEAALRSEIENEIKETDLNNTESNLDYRPLLEKSLSTYSDSDQSSFNANLDTIGPLENPRFLKMLNYSVSRTVQDDGFRGNSNLDLASFTGTEPSADMDRGWAWVVLFAAFCSLSLTGATTFAAGVLMSSILKIDPDMTKASWIGAVHISVLCMSGPFVGTILSRLGARRTVFFAGIVLSSGLIGASFSSSIIELIFTHGLISGIGSGFILNTMYVTVGQYFNRYRGLACGLLATGSGVGMLAGGNAMTALVSYYGLRGTYLLWAGVTLHSLVFAMLLHPSPAEKIREAEKRKKKKIDNRHKHKRLREFRGNAGSMRSGTNSISSGRASSFKKSQKSIVRTSQQDLGVAPLLKTVLHREVSRSTYSINTNRSVRTHRNSNLNIPADKKVSPNQLTSESGGRPESLNISSLSATAPPVTQTPSPSIVSVKDQAFKASLNDKKFSTEENIPLINSSAVSDIPVGNKTDSSLQNTASSPTFSRAPSELNRSFRKRLISGSSQAPSNYTSTGRLSYRPSIREQLQRNDLDNESLASTLVSHLQPQDALSPRYRLGSRSVSSMFGSITSFPTALVMIKDDLSRIEAIEEPKEKTVGDYCISLLDSMRLLRNKPFLVFITTCMLWALADSPFSMYLPSYTMSKGSTAVQASSLYTAIGFGSMCGRFLSGLVASDSGIGPILLHIGCLSIASLVVIISPWITSTYLEQMVCAGLFGLYTGSLVPLSSLITIELLGIGELGLGFGFLSLAQGIGYLAGPPLLGFVIKTVGFEMGFRIAGFILLGGSFLDMMIAVLIRKVDDESIHDSFDDLERALGRISDNESDENDDSVSHQDKRLSTLSTATSTIPCADVKNKEIKVNETSFIHGAEHKEEPKLKPLSETNLDASDDLGTITEEA